MPKGYSASFCIILFLHLSSLAGWLPTAVGMVTKVLLIPVLIAALLTKRSEWKSRSGYVSGLLALLCSVLGDGLLLGGESPLWFGLGLGAFLLAHVAYAFCFHQAREQNHVIPLAQKYLLITLAIVLAGILMFLKLHKHLGVLLVPVALYILAIVTMSVRAVNRYDKTTPQSFMWVTCGASLFMLSDSLLALDKFSQPIPGSPLMVMSTYGLAQFSIAQGLWKHFAGH